MRAAAEEPLPHVVADDDGIHWTGVGFFFLREGPAKLGLNAEQMEKPVRDPHADEALRMFATILLVLADVGRDALEDVVLAAVIAEVGGR